MASQKSKDKSYIFRQQHVIGFIPRRLDYFMVSNNLQESIDKSSILSALSLDHSPIYFSLSKNIGMSIDKSLWKFNNSLFHKPDFITELKKYSKFTCNRMPAEQITDEQLGWEYIKHEIKKISIRLLKEKGKKLKNVPRLLH